MYLNFAILGPIGYISLFPGTLGSLLATISATWVFLSLSTASRAIFIILLFCLGALAADKSETILKKKDPRPVIIDEVFGQFLVFMPFASLHWSDLCLGFILFRLFDIFKPWPIRHSENLFSGGFGIMIDDLLAGIYAAICLGILVLIL